MMAGLAWGRVLISLMGFLLGWVIIWYRPRFLAWILILWGLISVIWGLLSYWEGHVIFQALVTEDLTLVGVVLSLLAVGLHLVWPGYVMIRVFLGIRVGQFVRR